MTNDDDDFSPFKTSMTNAITELRASGLLMDLAGTSVCFTGTQSMSRDRMHRLVHLLGGVAHSSMSKSTSILVVPDNVKGMTSKHHQARVQGTVVLKESEFVSYVNTSKGHLLGKL